MRNVELHVDATTTVRIVQRRGELISTSPNRPPVFDDSRFVQGAGRLRRNRRRLRRADAALNRYLFSYKGSPLRDLKVTTADGLLKIEGELRKGVPIPFSITGEPSVLPDGILRLHPVTVKLSAFRPGA